MPSKRTLDPSAFNLAKVGPYGLGPAVRYGRFGRAFLAIGPGFEEVLEIELLESVPAYKPECPGVYLLECLNHVVGLRHRSVMPTLGAGVHDGKPYILRPHRLGRTLAELIDEGLCPPTNILAAVFHDVALAIEFLAEAGPKPGICSIGGVGAREIFIGWCGRIAALGSGLAAVRDPREQADLEGLINLAHQVDGTLGCYLESATSAGEIARRIRHKYRDTLARGPSLIGSWFRHIDAERCEASRRFFRLEIMH